MEASINQTCNQANGVDLIAVERKRLTEEFDISNKFISKNFPNNELLGAAMSYFRGKDNIFAGKINNNVPISWPEGMPKTLWQNGIDRLQELAKAGAFIAAEIDRLLALQEQENGKNS